jgi:hypothetical protein
MTVLNLKNCLAGLLLIFLAVACGESPLPTDPPESRTIETLVAGRWSGSKRIATDTNSAFLQELVKLPESVNLMKQTLDKLSRASWGSGHVPTNANASVLVRPLLNDLLSHECLFEMATVGNQSTAYFLAVRLGSERSTIWETNLASVVESLTGKRPSSLPDNRPGWISHSTTRPVETSDAGRDPFPAICFTRLEGWTVVGTAPDLSTFDSIAKRILDREAKNSTPASHWLEATIDLPRLSQRFSIPTNLFSPHPVIRLNVSGKNQKVATEMTLTFARALNLNLRPWNVPTNLIEKPSASFSAIRGLDGLLSASKAWQSLGLTPTPDQMYGWALQGEPRFTFFAAHVSDATGFVSRATRLIVPNGQGWLNEEGITGFKKSTEHDGVEWQGLPYLWPFLRSAVTNGQTYVLGGTFVYAPVIEPISELFYEDSLRSENLVFFGWEQSDQRIQHWLFIGQFIRFVSDKAQLPFQSASVLWLKAIESQLGESITQVHLTQPNQLRLSRSSSVGLTAIELHILADWLESPEFPCGFHTLLSEPTPRP